MTYSQQNNPFKDITDKQKADPKKKPKKNIWSYLLGSRSLVDEAITKHQSKKWKSLRK